VGVFGGRELGSDRSIKEGGGGWAEIGWEVRGSSFGRGDSAERKEVTRPDSDLHAKVS
jgi:hypothetical protein